MPSDFRDEIEESIRQLSGEASPEPSPAPSPEPSPAPSPSASSGQRDASGRFAPKTPATNEVPPAGKQGEETLAPTPTPAPTPAPGQQTTQNAAGTPIAQPPGPVYRPPVAWSPEEREGWEKLDPRHQQAILRRERDIDTALNATATARKFAQEVTQVIAPYMPMIEAENSTPVRAIQEVMKTAAVLRTAPPVARATAVADLILQFGIDLNTLDNVLTAKVAGRPGPSDPIAPIQRMIEQQLAPVQQFMSKFQQGQDAARQREEQATTSEVEAFINDPANEFAADVAADMAELLEAAAARGRQMSLQDAYARATLLHPTISQIIMARKSGQGLAQQTAAAQNARNAAVSVTNHGAPSARGEESEQDDGDIRSALGASIRQLSTAQR